MMLKMKNIEQERAEKKEMMVELKAENNDLKQKLSASGVGDTNLTESEDEADTPPNKRHQPNAPITNA